MDLATIHPDEFSNGHVAHGASWPDNETAAEDREEEWLRRMETAENSAKLALAGPFAHMKYRPTLNGEHFADYGDLLDVHEYLRLAGGFTFEVLVPGKPLQQEQRRSIAALGTTPERTPPISSNPIGQASGRSRKHH